MAGPFSLMGKTVVVTGASSGIGKMCAISCSRAGANVVLVARNEQRLQEAFAALDGGGTHLKLSCDISLYSGLEEIVSIIRDGVGCISGLIHSACIEMTLPLRDMRADRYESLLGINSIAGLELARLISRKKFFSESGASFVFISSVMGSLGQPGKVGYCTSKGALIAGVKAMALELAEKKIRANCISPGVVETEMTRKAARFIDPEHVEMIRGMHPLGFGAPQDIALACVFLLSDAARWITGTNLIIDGGYSAH